MPQHEGFQRAVYGSLALPVIDVTLPAFQVALDKPALLAAERAYLDEEERRARIPGFLSRFMVRMLLKRSRLGRALLAAQDSFLDGMSTYLMKLGPDNMDSSWAVELDRRIGAGFPALCMRIRMQDMARLLAEGLSPRLESQPGAALQFFNIAGGPAMDSLNALILLNKERPGLLKGRKISVTVLDPDTEGPAFGASALAALLGEGGPLQGLDLRFRHQAYDWNDFGKLAALAAPEGGICAISSEGGLLEYGSDDQITGNLKALSAIHSPGTVLVGSVTRDDGPITALKQVSKIPTQPRSHAAFLALAEAAGWKVETSLERPFSRNLRLARI